jgi:hypothetical protein
MFEIAVIIKSNPIKTKTKVMINVVRTRAVLKLTFAIVSRRLAEFHESSDPQPVLSDGLSLHCHSSTITITHFAIKITVLINIRWSQFDTYMDTD